MGIYVNPTTFLSVEIAMKEAGLMVLLIEHHMELVMEVCDRVAVLNFGRKIAEGTPAEVRANPAVIAAYLGQQSDDEQPSAVPAGTHAVAGGAQ